MGAAGTACAQPASTGSGQAYPNKPVRMIIPFAAGGATDVVIRIVANRLPEVLGQQVAIDNRPGAGGLIGTELASGAIADGYTLLATGTPHVIVPNPDGYTLLLGTLVRLDSGHSYCVSK